MPLESQPVHEGSYQVELDLLLLPEVESVSESRKQTFVLIHAVDDDAEFFEVFEIQDAPLNCCGVRVSRPPKFVSMPLDVSLDEDLVACFCCSSQLGPECAALCTFEDV